jgi:hypothetical protein
MLKVTSFLLRLVEVKMQMNELRQRNAYMRTHQAKN